MNTRVAILLSGGIWAVIGLMLLYKGLKIVHHFTEPQAAVCLIAGGLLIGFLKGRFVLSKTVQRISERILSLSEPIGFLAMFPKTYWILLCVMVGLGMILRFAPDSLHGLIDIAVGSALLNGAMLYFRVSRQIKKQGCE